jgi:uncharacterized membrane protein YfcA
MWLTQLLGGVAVGLIGGVTSGLLGVSPGGGLVVFSVLLLGVDQHVAQGISLTAQVPPTSLAGIRRYRETGLRTPLAWLVLLTIGFVVGGVVGALAAGKISVTALQWTYVVYLIALDGVMLLQTRRRGHDERQCDRSRRANWMGLAVVGAIGGLSSGFLGIGGGLAITVGLTAGLKASRHQAQLVSLVLALAPTTIPAAWVYWQQGSVGSWVAVSGVILGLLFGTDVGARLAKRVSEATLHRTAIGFVSAMALYMAYKALS